MFFFFIFLADCFISSERRTNVLSLLWFIVLAFTLRKWKDSGEMWNDIYILCLDSKLTECGFKVLQSYGWRTELFPMCFTPFIFVNRRLNIIMGIETWPVQSSRAVILWLLAYGLYYLYHSSSLTLFVYAHFGRLFFLLNALFFSNKLFTWSVSLHMKLGVRRRLASLCIKTGNGKTEHSKKKKKSEKHASKFSSRST